MTTWPNNQSLLVQNMSVIYKCMLVDKETLYPLLDKTRIFLWTFVLLLFKWKIISASAIILIMVMLIYTYPVGYNFLFTNEMRNSKCRCTLLLRKLLRGVHVAKWQQLCLSSFIKFESFLFSFSKITHHTLTFG